MLDPSADRTRLQLIRELRAARILEARLKDDELNRIELNRKQWQFATTHADEAYLSGPNQVGGKTTALLYIARCHLTGDYPDEWDGPRFKEAPYIIMLSVTNEKTQETLSDRLFGPFNDRGTGYLPKDSFDKDVDLVPAPGGAKGQLKEAYVRHKSGGRSHVRFASYQRGWDALQGSTPQVILCDEEPYPWKVYDELSARLNKTRGIMRIAASPTHGKTRVRKMFKSGTVERQYIPYTVYDCDHIDEEHKQALIRKYENHPFASVRLFGEEAEGEGLLYPVDFHDLLTPPIEVPVYWKQIVCCDLAHTPSGIFAVVRLIYDKQRDTIYYDTGRKGSGQPRHTYAEWLRTHGGTVYPVSWPHDGNRQQHDGQALSRVFRDDYGLRMLPDPAHRITEIGGKSNAVYPIIEEVYDRMVTGRFKVFDRPENEAFHEEISAYISKDGEVKNGLDDHLIDAMHKGVMDLRFAESEAEARGNLRGQARRTFKPRKRDFYSGKRTG